MSAPLPSREEIIACLEGNPKPLHAGVIAKRCSVDKASYDLLVELLEQLAREGTLRRIGRNRYASKPRRRSGESWNGILSVNPRGFGFVTASGKPDVFVPPPSLGAAMHGDMVAVEVVAKTSRGVEGRVASIERRRDPRVAGTLRRTRSSAWLEPDDPRVRGPIVIVEGREQCRDGDAAIVEITRFPDDVEENPEGRLSVVLGKSGDAFVEVAKILVREQIEEGHPEAAMQEAEALAMRTRRLELGSREDLRSVPFLTIDPTDARDHDDAVYAEKTSSGYRVYVAIADVAEYVQPGSALDTEATRRGCTIYLPDRAIPMLPGLLAADACSLLPDCERYCMCVVAEMNQRAEVTRVRVVEGLMRAAAMISYEGAARALGFSDQVPESPQALAFKKELKVLAAVASKLRSTRMKRGALDLDLPEAKLVIDPKTGVPSSVRRRAGDPGVKRAYQIVEEMMLLANELVARWLGKKHSPAIFRVHGKPDEEKLERLGEAAKVLGAPFDFDAMLEPLGVSKWLAQIKKHIARPVLEGLLLRSLKQAIYDIANIGHFGLASDAYVHFTSPIRRYPDLSVHRAIKAVLRGATPDASPTALETLRTAATHASFRERAAMQVEREVVDLYRTLYMRDRLGEIFEGAVVALLGSGIIVSIVDPFVEVMVRFESLGQDRFELTDSELSLVGQRSGEIIALGDSMMVEVEDISIARRTVYARRIASIHPELPSREPRGRGRRPQPAASRTERPRKGRPPPHPKAASGERARTAPPPPPRGKATSEGGGGARRRKKKKR